MNSTKAFLRSLLEIRLFSSKLNISIFTFLSVFFVLCTDFSVYTLMVLCCIFIHELAHLAAMRLCRCTIQKINVYPFGIDIICDMNTLSYKKELLVVLSGGAANLLLALIVYVFLGASRSVPICFFIYANLFFGIGNLIPLPVFDGGRALHIIISSLMLPDKAYYVQKAVDGIAYPVFFALSVYFLMFTKCNFTAVMCVAYTALAAIIYEKLVLKKHQSSCV